MHPKNIEGTTKLAKTFKEKFPNKNLWAWTGFKFDKDLKDKEAFADRVNRQVLQSRNYEETGYLYEKNEQ